MNPELAQGQGQAPAQTQPRGIPQVETQPRGIAQVPASGRRRQAPAPRARAGRWPVPKLAAAGVALIGALLVLAGGLRATTFAPAPSTQATVVSPRQSVVSTAVGLLGLEGPRLEVDATADSPSRPIFVGIGRAHDVDAYLAQVARLELIGDDGNGTLLTKRIGSEAALPDPAGVDVWVVSSRGPGTASVVWSNQPGQWRLVVATDGAAAAAGKVALTWSGKPQHSPAPALISIGLVLLVAGLITLVMLGSRSRLEGDQ